MQTSRLNGLLLSIVPMPITALIVSNVTLDISINGVYTIKDTDDRQYSVVYANANNLFNIVVSGIRVRGVENLPPRISGAEGAMAPLDRSAYIANLKPECCWGSASVKIIQAERRSPDCGYVNWSNLPSEFGHSIESNSEAQELLADDDNMLTYVDSSATLRALLMPGAVVGSA